MTYLKRFWPQIFILIVVLLFFSPVILKSKIPLPADTIPGLYHPMRDAVASEYPNGPPYKNFLITDSVRQQYVWRQFSINEFKQGRIPWWNPYNFSGNPHLANFQSASLYPLNLVFAATDFTTAWNMLVISQMLLGANFMYLFLRNKKLEKTSSLFGGLAWIFSGFFVVWLEWNTAAHVAIWSPLILLSIEKIFEKSSIKWSLILFTSLLSQSMAGYPQPWVYLSLLQGLYLLYRWQIKKRPLKKLGMLAAIYLAFLIPALFQLLPTLEFGALSNRVADQGEILTRSDWFLPKPQLIQSIIPDFFGNPATLNYWGEFNYTEFVSYVGVTAFVLVLCSIFTRKKIQPTWFFIITLATSLLLATKNPISIWQFKLNIPFISSSQPSRWLVVTNLSTSILAAIGLDNLLKNKKIPYLPLAITGLLLASVWFVLLANPFHIENKDLSVATRNNVLPTLEFMAISAVFGYLFLSTSVPFFKNLHKKLKPNLFTAAALIFILTLTISGLRFANKFTPFSDRQFLYPDTKILTYLQENSGLHRYMTTDRRIMAPNMNMAYNLYTVEGYDPLYLNSYASLLNGVNNDCLHISACDLGNAAFNRIVTLDRTSGTFLNLMGVKHILSLNPIEDKDLNLIMQEGQTFLYEREGAVEKAFILDPAHPYSIPGLNQNELTTIQEYQPTKITLKAQIPDFEEGTGLLIINDNYYPGWIVSIDGQKFEPVENWQGLRATIVPEGEHEVIFKYSNSYLQRIKAFKKPFAQRN